MAGLGTPMRRQFIGIVVSRGLGSALQAVALVLLARAVPPGSFGAVNIVIGVVGFVLVLTGLGMSVYVPWARARAWHDDVVVALRVNSLSNVASGVGLAAGLATWAWLADLPLGVCLIGVSLALERNADTWLGVPIADGKAAVAAVSVLLRRLTCLAVLLPALAGGVDPVWAYTGGLLIGSLAGQAHVRLAVRDLSASGRAPTTRDVVRRALPFLVSNATGQARTLDVSLVGLVLGPAVAGTYAAAVKLVQPLLLVPQSLGAVLLPHASKISSASARRLGARLGLAFVGCLLPAAPLFVWGERLVVGLMGPQYAGAGKTFAWALTAIPFIAWASSLGAILQGQGRERLVAVNGAVFALVMFATIALGAALAGSAGAAAGLAASYVLRSAALVFALVPPGSRGGGRTSAETDPRG